jgi:hypothetical protein
LDLTVRDGEKSKYFGKNAKRAFYTLYKSMFRQKQYFHRQKSPASNYQFMSSDEDNDSDDDDLAGLMQSFENPAKLSPRTR